MTALATPDWINGTPEDLRRWRNACPEVINPTLPPDVAISALEPMGACPGGLVFTPEGMSGLPIVYFHGGGFIVGSPETHRVVAAWIAHLTRSQVISVRYRLAPEHQMPAQADDAVAAVTRQLAVHPRLRLMGDSAGAMVALWACAGLSKQDRNAVEDAVLFNPGGFSRTNRAASDADEAIGLGPKSLASYQRRLDPKGIVAGSVLYDPLAPGFAMPRLTTIVGAGDDPILDSSYALAALTGTKLIVADGQTHGFLSALPDATAMGWLKRALALAH